MNHCVTQQRNMPTLCDEMISREALVCPKPIRVGVFNSNAADPIRTIRWNLSHQTVLSESAAGADLLDILLLKGASQDLEPHYIQLDPSPPFFNGSPPSRLSNPVIQDARFREEKLGSPVSQLQLSINGPSSSSSYSKKGGYARPNFGNNPTVRIEGFANMNRDGRNSAVPTRA